MRIQSKLVGLMMAGLIQTASASGVQPGLGDHDCQTMLALHDALLADDDEMTVSARQTVEDAIFARPGCGETRASLRDVRSGSGANPFDDRAPGGYTTERGEATE